MTPRSWARMCVVVLLVRGVLAQALDESAFARDLARILPAASEREFLTIPWRSQLRQAMVEANRVRKPVLLWAMNGHPLGQT